jgi:hypothetical protein
MPAPVSTPATRNAGSALSGTGARGCR